MQKRVLKYRVFVQQSETVVSLFKKRTEPAEEIYVR